MMHATCSNANPPQEPTRCWCSNAEKCDCGKRMGEDAGLLANFESAERVNINTHFLSLLTSSSSLRGSQQALRPASLIVQGSSHDPLSAAIARSITSCIANIPNLNLSHTILNQIGRANTNFPGSQNDEFNSGTCTTLILGSAPLLRQFYLFQRLFGMPNNFFRSLWPPHVSRVDSTFLLGQASAASDDNWFQNETRIDLWRQLLMESTLYMHRPPDSLLEGPTSFFVVTASRGVNFSMNAEAIFQRPLHFSIEMRNRSGAMWPDVDNMSYEELLALEDRIGYVSTGLSEEVAVTSLKRSHYFVFTEENTQKDFCSICQEDFVEEDELGTLDCGHGFHISCIKQWLGYKNVCPMCKSPGISTTLPSFSHIQSP
ncbi:uncharacterized protein LOC103949203 [Pyrus x bretschneideri]|uniref:uncharacterized protein LOC103949203 n=1 Tax=Pyrus x bretschneideri TaxID=225117 RepID=UPI000870B19B|nr:uncharacterized protein LOC103949203 [Pyrus x bretschneideri]